MQTFDPNIKRLVVVGYRGAGKSTVSAHMAKVLGWELISTDELLQQDCGMSIAEIVDLYGWEEFRKIEHGHVLSIASKRNCIVDCGGGVVESDDNMEPLMPEALGVWVDAGMSDIHERLTSDTSRPLLTEDTLYQDILRNYTRRVPMYEQYSKVYVNTSVDTLDAVERKVLKAMEIQKEL